MAAARAPLQPGSYLKATGYLTPQGVGVAPLAGSWSPRPMPAALRSPGVSLPHAGWIDPIVRPASWLGRTPRFGRLDRLTQLALVAAHHALTPELLARSAEGGVALGSAHGSHLANELFQCQLDRQGPAEVSPTLFAYTLPSSCAGELSIYFGLTGPLMTLTEGRGAGLDALGQASGVLQRDEAPWMLVVAVDTLSATQVAAASTPEQLWEAAAVLVLDREPDGALARVAGWSQARGPMGEVEQDALRRAGLRPRQLRQRLTLQPHTPCAGLGLAGAPTALLALCQLVQRGELPALIGVAGGDDETSHALCLAAVTPNERAP